MNAVRLRWLALLSALALGLLLRLWGSGAELSAAEVTWARLLGLPPGPAAELLARLPWVGLGLLLIAWGWRCGGARGSLLLASMAGLPLGLLWPQSLDSALPLLFSPAWSLGVGLALLGVWRTRRSLWALAALLPLLAGALVDAPLALLAAPALVLLMAAGSRSFDAESPWIGRGLALALALTLATTPLAWPAAGWREVAQAVDAGWRPGDALSLGLSEPVLDYYLSPQRSTAPDGQATWTLYPQALTTAPAGQALTAQQTLDSAGGPLVLSRWQAPPQTPRFRWVDGPILAWADLSSADGQVRAYLLWTSDAVPSADYSISVGLLDAAGRLVAQSDGQPAQPMRQWQPNEWRYEVREPLPLAEYAPLQGDFRLFVKLYEWRPDGLRDLPLRDGQPYADLGQVRLP